jgi:hypothetical protein
MLKLQRVKTREQERARREEGTDGGKEGKRRRKGGREEGLEGGMTGNGLRKVKRGVKSGSTRPTEQKANTSSL